jgi:dihydrofolate reductase
MNGEAQRRLILHMSVSLDGFVARRDGVVEWLGSGGQHSATRHHATLEMVGQAGLIVVGRRAYQDMAGAWSTSDSPDGPAHQPPAEGGLLRQPRDGRVGERAAQRGSRA